jgi:hypothetical protein
MIRVARANAILRSGCRKTRQRRESASRNTASKSVNACWRNLAATDYRHPCPGGRSRSRVSRNRIVPCSARRDHHQAIGGRLGASFCRIHRLGISADDELVKTHPCNIPIRWANRDVDCRIGFVVGEQPRPFAIFGAIAGEVVFAQRVVEAFDDPVFQSQRRRAVHKLVGAVPNPTVAKPQAVGKQVQHGGLRATIIDRQTDQDVIRRPLWHTRFGHRSNAIHRIRRYPAVQLGLVRSRWRLTSVNFS